MSGSKAADSDVRMMIATQVAYMDGDKGMTVEELLDRTIENYDGKSNLSERQKGQLDTAKYIRKQMQEHGLEDCNQWVIKEVADTNKETGFYACLIDTQDGDAILGYRGSESYSENGGNQYITDWAIADFGMLNNPETRQQKQAEQFARYVYNKYGDRYQEYSFTGHSLGGNLAEHATINAPDGMPIHRCVSLDGPGYSDQYIAAHAAQIRKNSKYVDHFQYSPIGAVLFSLPGTNYQTIAAHNDRGENGDEEKGFLEGSFWRHHTRNIEFDDNGMVQKGERDPVSSAVSVISKKAETVPAFPMLATAWMVMNQGYILLQTMREQAEQAVETIRNTVQSIKQGIQNWFRGMFGVKLRGEYEIHVSAVSSLGGNLDNAASKLSGISNEISEIASSLRYRSVAGFYYKSKLRTMSNTVQRDRTKAQNLAEAARHCAQYASHGDQQAAQCYGKV